MPTMIGGFCDKDGEASAASEAVDVGSTELSLVVGVDDVERVLWDDAWPLRRGGALAVMGDTTRDMIAGGVAG